MISPGKYRAVAMPGACVTETRSEKPYVAIDFRITAGEMAGESLSWRGWLTDRAQERTIAALRYAGWKGSDITDLGDLDHEVQIVVDVEEYEGKTRPVIKWVNALVKPLESGKAKALADRIRAKALAVPLVDGAPPSQEPSDDPFA